MADLLAEVEAFVFGGAADHFEVERVVAVEGGGSRKGAAGLAFEHQDGTVDGIGAAEDSSPFWLG